MLLPEMHICDKSSVIEDLAFSSPIILLKSKVSSNYFIGGGAKRFLKYIKSIGHIFRPFEGQYSVP